MGYAWFLEFGVLLCLKFGIDSELCWIGWSIYKMILVLNIGDKLFTDLIQGNAFKPGNMLFYPQFVFEVPFLPIECCVF